MACIWVVQALYINYRMNKFQRMNEQPIYVIGDIHGHYETLIELLADADIIHHDLTWKAGESTVIFMGDYVDRGPEGARVIDFLISLQIQAEMADGEVITMIGNHDLTIMAAHRFGDRKSSGPKKTFIDDWRYNGGIDEDLNQLTPEHIAWLTHLPAMVLFDDTLYIHADAMIYTQHGDSVEAVNTFFENLRRSYDPNAWDAVLEAFSEHGTFNNFMQGGKRARQYLDTYGGGKIVHGHTPIGTMIHRKDNTITEAHHYAKGLCINVDGGIYRGGPGFVHRLDYMLV